MDIENKNTEIIENLTAIRLKMTSELKIWEENLIKIICDHPDPECEYNFFTESILLPNQSEDQKLPSFLNSLEEGAVGNIKNFKKIIELIRKNSWEKNFSVNEYICSDDFKTICRTPIYIPSRSNLILGLLSGEYILNLLAKANGNEIKLEWRTGLKDNKIESYHRKLIKFFSSKSSNYYKFENRLQISLENLVVKKEKQGTLLWNIFEWYDYSIYDLNGNVDSKNKVFELFDIPYLLNFGGGSVSNKKYTLEIPEFFNGTVLFKTMMFQNIKEPSKLQILKLYDYLSETVATFVMLTVLILISTDNLMQSGKRGIDKKILLYEFQNELKKQIENLPTIDERLSNSVEKIQATEDNIFDLIFCRMNWREFKNLRDIFENIFLVTPKCYKNHDQVSLYREIDSTAELGVKSWYDFKEKYNLYLKEFFPEVSDLDKLEKYWNVAINLLCSSPFEITDKFPIKISFKSLSKDRDLICKIKTKIFFAVMFFVINSRNYEIKKIGKNTKLYEKVIGGRKNLQKNPQDNKKENPPTLYNVLRTIRTHYRPANRRHFYLTLFIQFTWWSLEQFYSFTVPDEILKLVRKFILEILNRCEIIMRVNDLSCSIKEAENLKNYLNSVPLEIFKKINFEPI